MDFNVSLVSDPPEARFTVVGDLDLATSPLVAEQMAEEIRRGCRQILIDLSGVTFVDATALGVFTSTHRALRVREGTMRFVAYQPSFHRLCRATGLAEHFGLS